MKIFACVSLKNIFLLAFSTFIALIIGEGILRFLYHPIDHLKPQRINDPVLGTRIKPHSAHYDAWGFRNLLVPDSADIIAIGDSMTFGINATFDHTWPAALHRLLNRSVYNISLGGYGPPQYLYLLENKAFLLKPSLVIIGFYFGNDIMNSYYHIYHYDYFKELRDKNLYQEVKKTASEPAVHKNKWFQIIQRWYREGSIHDWMRSHSIFYDLFRHQIRKTGAYWAQKTSLVQEASIQSDNKNISTIFTPQIRLDALNMDAVEVKEGLRITLELFAQMKAVCDKQEVQMLVVLIPTKESVYSTLIEGNPDLTDSSIVDKLIKNERQINQIIKYFFAENNIAHIDVLPSLQLEIGKKRIYPAYSDGHPNKQGYEVISKDIEHWYRNNPF
jgi:hypothetical protein